MSQNGNRVVSIPSILLIILIIIFHTELFVLGTRLYVAFANSPRAERLLGDYYSNNAHLSSLLANSFYDSALKRNKERLNDANPEIKAKANYQMGAQYECGQGVTQDLNEAKKWYGNAMQIIKDNKMSNGLEKKVQAAIDRVDSHLKDKTTPPVCPYQTDWEFIKKSIQG